MSDTDLVTLMTRNYDMRVLEKGPLWMWRDVTLYSPSRGVHAAFFTADWTIPETSHLWGLSMAHRTVFSCHNFPEASAAVTELAAMIKAARLLAGVDRA